MNNPLAASGKVDVELMVTGGNVETAKVLLGLGNFREVQLPEHATIDEHRINVREVIGALVRLSEAQGDASLKVALEEFAHALWCDGCDFAMQAGSKDEPRPLVQEESIPEELSGRVNTLFPLGSEERKEFEKIIAHWKAQTKEETAAEWLRGIYSKNQQVSEPEARILEYLDILRPRERLILAKRFGRQLSLKKVGELLRISKENVRNIQNRALAKLASAIERIGGTHGSSESH